MHELCFDQMRLRSTAAALPPDVGVVLLKLIKSVERMTCWSAMCDPFLSDYEQRVIVYRFKTVVDIVLLAAIELHRVVRNRIMRLRGQCRYAF